MRKLLTILFSIITVGVFAQSNPNSAVYSYKSLAAAIKTPKKPGWKVDVMQAGTVYHYVTALRSDGFVPDGGTILACADSVSVLILDRSQSHGIKLNWFLKGDNVTDNAAKMNWLVSAASPFSHFIIEQGDKFFCSQPINVPKAITIEGPDGYEVVTNTAFFAFPQAVNGFVFNNANSAGSVLRGFAIQSTLPESGRVLEYNSTNGTMLYIAPITALTAGKSFEFKDSYFPDKIKGTAVISNAGTNNIAAALEFYSPSGTFAIGDTVKGATSGAKAVVRFVSRIYNAVAVGTVTGTFKANETITGTASGASAKFYAIPGPARWQYAKVATMSNVSGSLDNQQGNIVDTSLHNMDTLQFNVTGSLDSVGLGGKRTNIFVEANKYSVGIAVNRRITLEDMTVTGFGGDGIYITSATTPTSNANLTRLFRVRSNANAGNGARVYSGDANHISIESSTMVNNAAWGICDMSFLGISISHTHLSVNMTGGFTSGTYINRKTVYDNPYTEGAYNNMDPWQRAENIMGGGALKLGGTDGLQNSTPESSTAGNSGAEFSTNVLKNNQIYTDLTDPHDVRTIFKSSGAITHNIVVENQGTPSLGKGGTYGFSSPYGSGYQGADIKNTTFYQGYIAGSQTTGATYGFDFSLRRNVPPTMTVTGGSGTGAILQVDILNGKATKVNVLAGGKKYPANGTTVTTANFPNTTFIPYIEDSVIKAVIIQGDSLTTNGDNDIYSVLKIQSNGSVIPSTNATGTIGDATHHWKIGYIDSIVSSGTNATPVYNQNSSDQVGAFRLSGSTAGSSISNSTAAYTPLTIPGNALTLYGRVADPYYSLFNLVAIGATSGMHMGTIGNNSGWIGAGGYYSKFVNGINGGFTPLETTMSTVFLKDGKINFLTGSNLTPGTQTSLNNIANFDTTGTLTLTPNTSATSALITRAIVGANTNEFRFSPSTLTFGAFQNNVLSAINFSATQVAYNANLKMSTGKVLTFNSADGTNTSYGILQIAGDGNFYQTVNGINAQILKSDGTTVLGGKLRLKSYTVATLPTTNVDGESAYVTDALNALNGSPVVGGGLLHVPVYWNGSAWIVNGAGGYWQRVGKLISPAAAGDSISTTGNGNFGSVTIPLSSVTATNTITTNGTNGRLQFTDNSGTTRRVDNWDDRIFYQTPTSGGSFSAGVGDNIVEPAGTLSSLTILLPSASNGDKVAFSFTQAITTLTFTNGTLATSLTSAAAGSTLTLQFYSSTGKWYKF